MNTARAWASTKRGLWVGHVRRPRGAANTPTTLRIQQETARTSMAIIFLSIFFRFFLATLALLGDEFYPFIKEPKKGFNENLNLSGIGNTSTEPVDQ